MLSRLQKISLQFTNFVSTLAPPTKLFRLKRNLYRISGVDIGKDTKICGDVRIYASGKISIGHSTWVGIGCTFYCSQAVEIRIGDNCDIAPEVAFVTGSHRIGTTNRRAGPGYSKSIDVKNGCWLGARSTILPGVTIGEGSIVAAGSLVKDDVPANTLVAGVPARPVKELP